MPSSTAHPPSSDPRALRVAAGGAEAELLLLQPPAGAARRLLYWLPAMGVAARNYLPLARALAGHGFAVALHEWRGIGSSTWRAGRNLDWGYRELLQEDLPAGLAAARAALPQAPPLIGGHSLGGQLSALYAGLHPQAFQGLVLVASGAPYWRCFRHRWAVRAAYGLAPLLAGLCGHLPGRRIGFGGNEARGVIRDWARSGRTGVYAARGLGELEPSMARIERPLLALRLRDDWLGPEASLDWLLGKLPRAAVTREVLAPGDLHGPADHFGWMRAPEPVAGRIAAWAAAT
ncbi:alpha/beta hydrolase family protein [Fulvimonas soli]|uniref:Putative alpha/beta hydrolase n=1 Tax=Fulvimonas soli TaxID=155197 RepID=A0A316IXM7_9GAMM|nr:alpha/beta fold hydrolase [Fulvimonas soli]PWK91935.1 putative alpha/beta hydrolase [Fulvimonas soli]